MQTRVCAHTADKMVYVVTLIKAKFTNQTLAFTQYTGHHLEKHRQIVSVNLDSLKIENNSIYIW